MMRITTLRFAWLVLSGLLLPWTGRWSLPVVHTGVPDPSPRVAKMTSAAILEPGRFFAQGEEPLGCVAVIQYGQVVQCSVGTVGETNLISFNGISGERVRVRASETSGGLYVRLEIQRPNGATLCGPVTSDELTCLLDETGTFQLLVRDSNNSNTGTYGLSLQRLNGPVGCTGLSFGAAPLNRSISYAAEYDCYTFSGVTGDRVRSRVKETSGSLYIRQELLRPDGTTLCSQTTYEELDCILDSDGAYTLLVTDHHGANTGSYSVSLLRLNDPPGCTALSFGVPLSRSISYAAEYDCYSFSGVTGDRVRSRVKETSGSLYARQELLRADGTLICSQTTYDELDCILDGDGTYTLLVADHGGANTGSYGVSLLRLNAPLGCTIVDFGAATLSRSISYAAEYDCYTFGGATGDRVRSRVKETSGSLYARQELLRADGTVICSQTTYEELDCILDGDGTYALLVTDHGGANTGSYGLSLLRLNAPMGCSALSFGAAPLNRSISYAAEYDCYSFSGVNGDRVRSRVKETSGSLYARQELLRADGTVICSQTTYEELNCTLDDDGTYALLVTDNGGANTGSYGLSLLRLNSPLGCRSIAYGVSLISGSIGLAAEHDCYTFTGSADDQLHIWVDETSGSLYARQELLRADGTTACGPTSSQDIDCTLDVGGVYALLVSDQTGTGTGPYEINVLCQAGRCISSPPPLPPGSTRIFLPQVLQFYAFAFPGPWEREENDSFSLANGPLLQNRDYFGYPDDDRDFFYFHVTRPGQLDVLLSNHVGADVQFHIYQQASGQRVCYIPDPPFHCDISVQPGTYYIFIYTASGYSTTRPYTLRASFQDLRTNR